MGSFAAKEPESTPSKRQHSNKKTNSFLVIDGKGLQANL
jgi:hypothetical protein